MSKLLSPSAVSRLVSGIYTASVQEFRYSPDTDMSHSNKCHTMTQDLVRQLQALGQPVRRELHMNESGFWHFIVAHSGPTEAPSDEDVVTDMNPWQVDETNQYSGHLHGPRLELMETLRTADLPESYVAMRGLSTLVLTHTEALTPQQALRQVPSQV